MLPKLVENAVNVVKETNSKNMPYYEVYCIYGQLVWMLMNSAVNSGLLGVDNQVI